MAKRPSLAEQMRRNVTRASEAVVEENQRTQKLLSGAETGHAELPLDEIHPDPDQPRRVIDPERLQELKAAIVALGGLENPVQIYWHPSHGRWTIRHGARRWHALSELVSEGRAGFGRVPVRITAPPDRTLEGERRLRLAQVVENNARENLLPLDTAEQYLWIAAAGRSEPMSVRQLGELTGLDSRVAHRYLFVAGGLTAQERAVIRDGYPEAPLAPLYALVQWLGKEGATLDAEQRVHAVRGFAAERPSEKMIRVALRDHAPRKRPGRPGRRRFSAGLTRTGAFQVKLTLPSELTRDLGSIRRAQEDLRKAQEQLEELARKHAADPGQVS